MRQKEYDLLANNERQAKRASDATFLLLPLGVFLTLAILSLSFFFLNSGMGERAQAETDLRAAEQKYRSIFENAVAGIFQSRPDGGLISANPALARMCGYSSPQEMTSSVSDVSRIYVDPQRRAEWKHAIEAKGQVNHFEYELYRKDGSRIWVSQNCRAVRNADGTTDYYEGTLQDITERMHAEEVERANVAKNEFLSRMSHELRTPLNAILGFSQLLERQNPTATQRNHLGYIVKAGRHLLGLINEVLDITRIEAGRLEMSLEPVRLADVLLETLDLIRPLAAERALQLEPDWTDVGDCHVLADRQRLKQVLLNLLGNAVKYTPPLGRVTCSIRISADRVRIAVRDTGPGIAKSQQSRLFVPFDRLGAERSDIEGSGLGLALCQRLLESMNGSIGVESEVQKGSTFWIELPRSESPIASAGLAMRRSETPGTAHDIGFSVLYIEDNLSNLALIEQLFAEQKYVNLLTAKTGAAGLEAARARTPDLILLDVHLPDMSGAEVISKLKSNALTCKTPVIIISADATQRQIDRLLAAGAHAYLTKPIDVQQFFDLVGKTVRSTDQTPEQNAA
jgi:PAS domain S-box-containing protein